MKQTMYTIDNVAITTPNLRLFHIVEECPQEVNIHNLSPLIEENESQFSPDSKRLAIVMAGKKEVCLINLVQQPCNFHFFYFSESLIAEINFSQNSNRLYVHLENDEIRIYDFLENEDFYSVKNSFDFTDKQIAKSSNTK